MATKIETKNGKTVTLLNPSEKGYKYSAELRTNLKMTNGLMFKSDKYGAGVYLTDTERAWRSGYLQARKDSTKCYKAQQKKK